jgi:hypothetical protein
MTVLTDLLFRKAYIICEKVIRNIKITFQNDLSSPDVPLAHFPHSAPLVGIAKSRLGRVGLKLCAAQL